MASEPPAGQLVPFRWPATWNDSRLLSLLEGSPINCLVFDGAQPAAAEAARMAGFAIRDWKALQAVPIQEVRPDPRRPVTVVSEAHWPHLKPAARAGGDQGISGPTGAPWIESTSWMAKLAASRAPGKPVWLGFAPPEDFPPADGAYRLAITDCSASGARWVIDPGQKLLAGLSSGNSDARQTWSSIVETLAFFEKRREWKTYAHDGPLGVISTFSGTNEFLGTEVLNLAARRNLLYRIIDRSVADQAGFGGLRALLWVDPERPPQTLAAKLSGFARQGGLLIVHRNAAQPFKGERALDCPVSGYELRSLGKGSVAVPLREWDDPYWLAMDAHNLVSRRHDPVRMFNASSLWVHYSVPPRPASGGLIQLVNFTGRPASSVSLRIQFPHKSVAIHTLENGGPVPLKPELIEDIKEYYLPAFSIYAALEVSA